MGYKNYETHIAHITKTEIELTNYLTIRIDKKTLIPLDPIPKNKHHKFYWYMGIIICGRALDRGNLHEIRVLAYKHLHMLRDTYLEKNSWNSTISKQFESAYKISKKGNNNLWPDLRDQEGDWYTVVLK
jgi:hypothetical protein